MRAKKALGMSLCVAVPAILDEDFGGAGAFDAAGRLSASSSSSSVAGEEEASGEEYRALVAPMTPTPTSSGLRLSRARTRSSKVATP